MTDAEKLSVIGYVRERFDSQDRKLDELLARIESLEGERDERRGQRQIFAVVGKAIAVISALIASIAALFGPPWH